jgi:uncharacterized protein (UPF0333 family)
MKLRQTSEISARLHEHGHLEICNIVCYFSNRTITGLRSNNKTRFVYPKGIRSKIYIIYKILGKVVT